MDIINKRKKNLNNHTLKLTVIAEFTTGIQSLESIAVLSTHVSGMSDTVEYLTDLQSAQAGYRLTYTITESDTNYKKLVKKQKKYTKYLARLSDWLCFQDTTISRYHYNSNIN